MYIHKVFNYSGSPHNACIRYSTLTIDHTSHTQNSRRAVRASSRSTPTGISQSMKNGRERYFPNVRVMVANEAPRDTRMDFHRKRKAIVAPSQGVFCLNENASKRYAYSAPAFVIIVPSSAYGRDPRKARMPPVAHTINTSPNEPE